MPSSSAALGHLLTDQCGLSEELWQEFSNPLGVLFTIYMTPTLILVTARAKELANGMLQRAQERVGTGCCKVSRE